MIIVSVTLHSAIDNSKTELARMHICNVEKERKTLRNYICRVLRGRGAGQLDRNQIQREGLIENWPAEQVHIWNLVATALRNMGYGPRRANG